jgi:hypothetical protein
MKGVQSYRMKEGRIGKEMERKEKEHQTPNKHTLMSANGDITK